MSHSAHAVRARPRSNQVRDTLRDVLAGARGGANRRRLLRALDERPRNANRLATDLGLDYKTVRHHLSVLVEVDAVTRGGDDYGAVYLVTSRARQHWDVLEELEERADGEN